MPAEGRQNRVLSCSVVLPLKHLTLIIAVLAMLAGALFLREHAGGRHADLAGLADLAGALRLDAKAPAAQATRAVRKCSQGDQALYTDGDCPAGSTPQALAADRVTVLPAAPRPPAVAASGAGHKIPNVRDLLGTPDEGSLKDKRMDRVIGE
jgi:hypothetical protein